MELRKGNCVLIDGEVREVFGITEGLIQYKIGNDIHYTEDWELIKLTEEVLSQANNLTKNGTDYDFKDGPLWFRVEDGNFTGICLDVFKGKTYLTCIEYLHELQDVVELINSEKLNYETNK